MKKIFIVFILSFVTQFDFFAQNVPIWINAEHRNSNWPTEYWYVGYAQDRILPGENVSKKLEALKLEAMNQLSESIILTVVGQSVSQNLSSQRSVNGQVQETISSEYRQNLRSASKATIANQVIETWHDTSNGQIYAFISVKKMDLESFYVTQINLALDKASSLHEIAAQYDQAGRKTTAKEKMVDALDILSEIEYFFTLLSAVNASSPILAKHQFANNLRKQLDVALSALDKGPSIFLSCEYKLSHTSDDAFLSDPHILEGIIKQSLSESKFRITDDAMTADYLLTLTTYTSQRSNGSNGFGLLSFYANVDGKLIQNRTQKELATFSFFRDPNCYSTGSTPELAATKAFKTPALKEMIMEKILDSIPQ